MRRSSTSSSDHVALRHRRWRTVGLLAVLALAGVELLLRLPGIRALLPPRTHYYHPVIAQRLDAIERLMSEDGRVDVLFVGSSIVMTNIDPPLFDRTVEGRRGRVVSFNAGLPGIWPIGVHLYLEHVWLPAAEPRIVVQGIRYAELAATTHAKHDTQVWTGRIERAWRDADLLPRLHARVVESMYLLQYRGALTRALQRYRDGLVNEHESDDDYAVRGYSPRDTPAVSPVNWEEDLPNEGTCGVNRCAVGFEALRRAIAAVRASGGSYVLLNVPEHPARWRGPDAADRYRHYVETLRAFAAEEGVAFVDPTDGSAERFAGLPYNDFSHMTAEGSRHFTQTIADRIGSFMTARLPNVPAFVEAGYRQSQ